MDKGSRFSRRTFFARSGAAGIGLSVLGLGMLSSCSGTEEPPSGNADWIHGIADPEIRAGVEAAIFKNLIPAATEEYYPGFFNISADGGAYGGGASWPGLDSWQMAGAYLLLGRTQLVLDYFDFVRASQRKDGDIPFAIFTGDTQAGGCLRGLKTPDDIFEYKPPKREGAPASSQETRKWIGLYEHWQPKANPLGALGAVCYLLTAEEIFNATRSQSWLRERLPSFEAAAKYLLSRKKGNGLIGDSGFYCELPPRYGNDGVTQCYVIHAFRKLAKLFGAAGDKAKQADWSGQADQLTKTFVSAFWRQDHFAEYIHAEHGQVDSHGLSDVNWAAVAFGIAVDKNLEALWPRLLSEKGFWWGDMPTLNVTKPFAYEKWEYNEPLPFNIDNPLHDVAAMGRVWYLEVTACLRMKAHKRLVESARLVCRAAKSDGYWRERYHPQPDNTVKPAGAQKYCEYAAVLARTVLGNKEVFSHAE
jgi:hypothetical protein